MDTFFLKKFAKTKCFNFLLCNSLAEMRPCLYMVFKKLCMHNFFSKKCCPKHFCPKNSQNKFRKNVSEQCVAHFFKKKCVVQLACRNATLLVHGFQETLYAFLMPCPLDERIVRAIRMQLQWFGQRSFIQFLANTTSEGH